MSDTLIKSDERTDECATAINTWFDDTGMMLTQLDDNGEGTDRVYLSFAQINDLLGIIVTNCEMEPAEDTVAAARAALDGIVILGTDKRPQVPYGRFEPPYYVVDQSKAEPEVDFPGDLIAQCDTLEEAKATENGGSGSSPLPADSSLLAETEQAREIARRVINTGL